MSEDQLINTADDRAPYGSRERAREVIEATLATLGESLSAGEARDLATELPGAFEHSLLERTDPSHQPLPLETFYDRVAERADLQEGVEAKVRAALAGVDAVVGDAALEEARAQLPPEYDAIFAPAQALGEADFVTRVRERADLDEGTAREAIRATLSTTGERISRGEAATLAAYVPPAFEDWLVQEASEHAQAFSREEFIARIAEREGVDEGTAREHARTVIHVLAAVTPERQFEAARAQLPDRYDALFAPE